MSVFDCVEERLLLYSGMVYHSYGLWTWYFSGEGELYYTNCPYEKELLHFFQLGNCQEFALSRKDEPEMPFLMSDPVGLVWLGEYIPCVDTERRFFVIGPAFCDRDSLTGIDDALRRRNLSKELSGGCRHLLHNLPVVDVKQFQHLARSLHYAIGFVDGEDMKLLMQVSDGMKTDLTEAEKWIDYEQEHHRERMLLTYVRDGNHGYGDLLDLFTRGAHMGHPGQSPARSARNTVLIFISQCARAAMEGGVPVKTAKETENMFVGRAEEQKTVTELIRLCREMMDTFIDQVIAHKEYASLSKPIYLCCDYIRTHLSEPVTLKELARQTGYTEYYLSRLFQKEMGVKLLDYIKQVRVDYAKILLSTTNLTVEQISEKLQFGTRNYFTKVFRKYTGSSPMQYRDTALRVGAGKRKENEKRKGDR